MYCSRHDVNTKHQQQVPNVKYLDYATLKYFKALSQTIKHSARTELLAFLGLPHHKEGHEMGQDDKKLPGYLLPASHSKLSKGYKAVTFYATVTSLLNNAYVLRKDGWKNSDNPYQRMVIKEKIDEMHEYLLDKNKVFLNNIIVTLPSDAMLVDEKGKEIDKTTKSEVVPITIQIPKKPNTIGMIDGQHRILSYHEGGKDDKDIKKLREKHALLVTGIIYPKGITEQEKVQFEAQLFLEVNANQTTASEDTRLYLNSVLKPFSAGAIAFKIVRQLNKEGALKGKIKEYFYEEDKLDANLWLTNFWYRYDFQGLVSIEKKESLYHIWKRKKKETLLQEKDEVLLEAYIAFCTKKINHFLDAVKKELKKAALKGLWEPDRNVENSFLSSDTLGDFLIALLWLLKPDKRVM